MFDFKVLFLKIIFSVLLFAGPACAGQVNTFIYHRFDESRYPSTNISSNVFRQQLAYLKQQNIPVLPLSEVARRLSSGEELPQHSASLCVDDAYSSFFDIAMPLLKEFGYPVTVFVNTDAVGKPGYMSWAQLQELHNFGVAIENHTASHAYLVEKKVGESHQEWLKRIEQDIASAQAAIRENLGYDATLFAYPYGEYSASVVEIARNAGFSAAFAQQSGVIHEDSNPFILPRFPMGGPYATFEGFVNKLHMKALVVDEYQPFTPVLGDNPPVLSIKVSTPEFNPRATNCFVQGDNSCHVENFAAMGNDWFRVIAEKPLTGRRNKYTLTFRDSEGGWHWYSHPWIQADYPAE